MKFHYTNVFIRLAVPNLHLFIVKDVCNYIFGFAHTVQSMRNLNISSTAL